MTPTSMSTCRRRSPAGTRLHLCLILGRFAEARLIVGPSPLIISAARCRRRSDRDPRPGGVKKM